MEATARNLLASTKSRRFCGRTGERSTPWSSAARCGRHTDRRGDCAALSPWRQEAALSFLIDALTKNRRARLLQIGRATMGTARA
jgi:hypothetical protein